MSSRVKKRQFVLQSFMHLIIYRATRATWKTTDISATDHMNVNFRQRVSFQLKILPLPNKTGLVCYQVVQKTAIRQASTFPTLWQRKINAILLSTVTDQSASLSAEYFVWVDNWQKVVSQLAQFATPVRPFLGLQLHRVNLKDSTLKSVALKVTWALTMQVPTAPCVLSPCPTPFGLILFCAKTVTSTTHRLTAPLVCSSIYRSIGRLVWNITLEQWKLVTANSIINNWKQFYWAAQYELACLLKKCIPFQKGCWWHWWLYILFTFFILSTRSCISSERCKYTLVLPPLIHLINRKLLTFNVPGQVL